MANDKEGAGFLSRWSRRKAEVRAGRVSEVEETQQAQQTLANATDRVDAQAQPMSVALASAPPHEPALDAPPVPTMDDVQQLTPASDYRAFMSQNVAPDVKNAAMKKLFTDPHFNVMDRMDVYIDDYSLADPLPAAMLQKMASAQFMRLVDEVQEPSGTALSDDASKSTPVQDAAIWEMSQDGVNINTSVGDDGLPHQRTRDLT